MVVAVAGAGVIGVGGETECLEKHQSHMCRMKKLCRYSGTPSAGKGEPQQMAKTRRMAFWGSFLGSKSTCHSSDKATPY